MTCIYVMQSQSGRVKVGSSGSPEDRRKAVEREIGEPVMLLHWIECGNLGLQAERAAQDALMAHKTSGDWFDIEPEIAIGAIKIVALRIVGTLDMPRQQALDKTFMFRASKEWLEGLDTLRSLEPDMPSRPEMLRRCVLRLRSDNAGI